MMDTGLNTHTASKIFSVFKRFPQIEKVILYGSRAMGTYKPGSDIDISLIGKDLTQELVWKVSDALEDMLLPYVFDISLYETIDNPGLKEHISKIGIILYESDS